MRTNQTKFSSILMIVLVWLASLACGDMYGLIDPTLIAPSDLTGMDLSSKRMIGFDFSNKTLRGVDFSFTDLDNANFTNSDCRGSIFDHAILVGADFSGAVLDEKWALIMDVLVSEDGRGKDLIGYDLSKTTLGYFDFTKANLQGANLQYTNLVGTIFSAADLSGADFTGATLRDTDFSYANLTGAIISEIQFTQARLRCTILPDGNLSGVQVPEDTDATPDHADEDILCSGSTISTP